MCATLASICSRIKWKQGSGTFRLKPSSSTHYNATIQETFPRATLHLLHRYPFIPRVLLCCVSRRRSASLASAPSEASCIGSEYHTSLTGFVGKPGLCALVSLCRFIFPTAGGVCNPATVKIITESTIKKGIVGGSGKRGFQLRTESDRNQL